MGLIGETKGNTVRLFRFGQAWNERTETIY